jgi:hypothetical protein
MGIWCEWPPIVCAAAPLDHTTSCTFAVRYIRQQAGCALCALADNVRCHRVTHSLAAGTQFVHHAIAAAAAAIILITMI